MLTIRRFIFALIALATLDGVASVLVRRFNGEEHYERDLRLRIREVGANAPEGACRVRSSSSSSSSTTTTSSSSPSPTPTPTSSSSPRPTSSSSDPGDDDDYIPPFDDPNLFSSSHTTFTRTII